MNLNEFRDFHTTAKHLTCVIGDPIAHSISPAIHNTLFAHYGIDAQMVPVRVPAAELPAFLATAKEKGVLGLSITMPLKQAILPHCTFIEEHAAIAQSVNCVTFEEDGLHATSTDAAGLRRALLSRGISYEDRDTFVFGAGAVTLPLLLDMARECGRITLTNRTIDKAEAIAHTVDEHASCETAVVSFTADAVREAISRVSLILNTTSLGMHGTSGDYEDLSFFDAANRDAFVCDLIYNPAQTSFLAAAKAHGLQTENGLPMLLFQAFEIFYHFTGIRPKDEDIGLVKKALPAPFQTA